MRRKLPAFVFSVAIAAMALGAALLFRPSDRLDSQELRADEGAAKQLLPDEATREEASAYIKKLYAPDYARARSDASRLLLAKRLLRIADDTKDDGDALCGLLLEAKRLAVDCGDVEVAFMALDRMQSQFQYDSSLDKATVLEQLSGPGASITSVRTVTRLAMSVIEQATAADRFEAAQKALQAGKSAATRILNGALARQLEDLEMPIEALKRQHENLQKALVTLEGRPEDKESNLVVGRVLALRNGDWINAERHANLSADEDLRKLLLSEIDKPSTVKSRLSHADAWWNYSLTLEDVEKQQAQLIATGHYQAVLPELTGLTKNRIEKRAGGVRAIAMLRNVVVPLSVEIADVPVAVRRIDLLADFDVSRDVDHGAVQKNGRILEAEASAKDALFYLGDVIPKEYTVEIVATPYTSQGAGLAVYLVREGRNFIVELCKDNTCFVGLDGKDPRSNGTARRGAVFQIGRDNTIVCRVKDEGVTVLVNDKQVLELTDYRRLTTTKSDRDRATLAIGVHSAPWRVRKATLVVADDSK